MSDHSFDASGIFGGVCHDGGAVLAFSQRLLMWYDSHKRSLPWRDDPEPYRVWLSEIMLQQTRVEVVKDRYLQFLQAWPTVGALSEAPVDAVLKAWEGLGYYSRARNLHKTARLIASQYHGRFPDTVQELNRLPGVGPYTAAAVVSICYGVRVPALDGNQARILSRITARCEPLGSPQELYALALTLLSEERPGDQNQAYMDLANAVCLAQKPLCSACPVEVFCRACREEAPQAYPVKLPRAPKSMERITVAVVMHPNGGVFVRRREDNGLLGGLYSFALLEGSRTPEEALAGLREQGFDGVRFCGALPPARHVFTHKIWSMQGYHMEADYAPKGWERVQSFDDIAIPSALRIYRECAEQMMDGRQE